MSQVQPTEGGASPPRGEHNQSWTLEQVAQALRGLRFGTVTLLVQDGVVVQVERTEKRRYERRPADRVS